MNGKRIAVGLVAGALLVGGTMWAGKAYAWGGHHHGSVGIEGALPVYMMVKKADLTDAQERQVADILRNHKAALDAKTASATAAQRKVVTLMTADVADANALAAAWDNAATTRKDLVLEWTQVRSEVQGLLTPQQVSDLKAQRDKFMKKVDARHAKADGHGGERLEKWIERLSK